MSERVQITKLPTGVRGLDEALGGGIPELSFNLIAGGPGAGKTTLAHQIMFALASAERPALYITILGEPPLKMLRYQQQYAFFDGTKIPRCVQFLHLGADLIDHGLDEVLARIIKEVQARSPKVVFVDSFRAVVRKSMEPGQMQLQSFVQRLSLHLTGWEATTFLVGEYEQSEAESNSIFTVADGIMWLSQAVSRSTVVRKLQVVKMRGQASIPGFHTMTISDAGLRVYPRMPAPMLAPAAPIDHRVRRATGIAGLDDMLGGGLPAGYSAMVVGPAGSGKTILGTQFVREGIRQGERAVIAVFERRPDEYLRTVPGGDELAEFARDGSLRMLYLRPLDLSVDETMEEIGDAVRETGATRVVIDSLMGFELALAPTFREDFREALYRLVGALTRLAVTVVMTAEVADAYGELRLGPREISFLPDAIIVQRYAELGGRLEKVLAVAKLRGFDHANELRRYDIGADGIVIGEPLLAYEGVLSGAPRRTT